MRAYRLTGAAADPMAGEGPVAVALWEAGAQAVALEGADLVGYFLAEVELHGSVDWGRWEQVDERDHVAAYHRGLQAVSAGPLVVAPTHRELTLAPGQQVVWLDPGMAFGTGHHPTTLMALQALGALDLHGAEVLDVGAGSGVLAIAADRLGAARAWGMDIDPATVEVARANARLNHARASFEAGAFGEVPVPRPVDLLVANLYAELHLRLLPGYLGVLRPGGRALLTGIYQERGARMLRQGLASAWVLEEERWDGDWALMQLRRAPP